MKQDNSAMVALHSAAYIQREDDFLFEPLQMPSILTKMSDKADKSSSITQHEPSPNMLLEKTPVLWRCVSFILYY